MTKEEFFEKNYKAISASLKQTDTGCSFLECKGCPYINTIPHNINMLPQTWECNKFDKEFKLYQRKKKLAKLLS